MQKCMGQTSGFSSIIGTMIGHTQSFRVPMKNQTYARKTFLSAILAFTALCAAENAPTVVFTPSILVDSTDLPATHTPTITGTVTSCIVSPNLPIGLKIHNTTCVISGTPRVETLISTYTITASNNDGSGSFDLTISVPKKNNVSTPSALLLAVNGQEKFYAFGIEAGKGTEKLTLSIIDTWGRTVWSRTVNPAASKIREVIWNGRNANGTLAAAGMYGVRATVSAGGTTTSRAWRSVTLNPR